MTRLIALFVAGLLLLLSSSAVEARSNYKIKGEVRPQSGGFRHVVIVKNKTRNWLNCEAWTDVDPLPVKVFRVGPRNTYEVVIRTRAEEDTFIPYGFCRF